jgi:hypothetical protein
MPKTSTYPTCFEDLHRLSLPLLRERGFLKQYANKSEVISWHRGKYKTGSIRVTSYMDEFSPTVTLTYQIGERSMKESIDLVSLPSNLGEGKGKIWYFLCPVSGKRCRMLYLSKGRFVHREESKGEFYQKQIESKQMRDLEKAYGPILRRDRIVEESYQKHFKKFYAGKPTRRYARILKAIDKAEKAQPFARKLLEKEPIAWYG